jgi:phosphatidylethanolamine/phosphatidyl-N-methylethanolamine N-methyltransferase
MADERTRKNESNRRKYRRLAAIYDLTVKNPFFERARRREFELAQIRPHDRVLIVGIGTGLDLPYLPAEAEKVGIDLSAEMLARARRNFRDRNLALLEMSAEDLKFDDASFDVVVMNLVLSVVQDPKRALVEAARVLKPGGSVWILGSFASSKPSLARKMITRVATAIGGGDFSLSLDHLLEGTTLRKQLDERTLVGSIVQLTLERTTV